MNRLPRWLLPLALLCALATGPAGAQGPAVLGVSVDPRVELLSIVQVLGDRMDNGLDFPYKREVMAHFGRWRDHEAVRRIRLLAPDRFSWGVPATLGVALGPLPALAASDTLPTKLSLRQLTQGEVRGYVDAVRDFAKVSDFEDFFRAHRGFYDSLATATRLALGGQDYLADVERFWGGRQASYAIYLSPLMPAGGVGPRLPAPDGTFHVRSVLGARSLRDSLPWFGGAGALRQLVLHEFSHAFVNPVVDRHAGEIGRSSLLFVPVQNRLKQADGLTTWSSAVQEFVIRAFTANLTAAERGDSAARATQDFEKLLGFAYLDEFREWLREYAADRDRYPTFESYVPRLARHLDQLAASGLGPDRFTSPFPGNMAMARWHDENMFWVFVVPTAEPDPARQDSLHALVRRIRDANYPASFIVSDRDALSQDLSRYALWVFGTPDGNLWLRAHRDLIPARIEPDRIEADSTYHGTGLMFVTALPNPANASKPLLLSTGQRIEDVSRAFWVWDQDYAIMDGSTLVGGGNYGRKDGDRWAFR